ncbi:hypothetical protein CHCC14566_3379 [Bacillus licheniformis]|nr:hypothetical protein CHCC14566_3379 [Bacillus licheniformis]
MKHLSKIYKKGCPIKAAAFLFTVKNVSYAPLASRGFL